MEVCFLGYSDMNFQTKDGSHIDGVKVFYYYPTNKPNYVGFESGSYFVGRSNQKLIENIRHCVPGNYYRLNMGYDGRKAVLISLDPVKAS